MDDQLKLVDVVLQRMQKTLECTICLDLLQNPYTTNCGHSFCNECLDRLFLEAKGSTKCPLCNTPVTKRSLTQNPKIVSFVKAVKEIILSIKQDFGVSEPPVKLRCNVMVPPKGQTPIEVADNKRAQRKRGQTMYFDAQINMLPRTALNTGMTAENCKEKDKSAANSTKIIQQASAATSNYSDLNVSVEKVTDWLSKKYIVNKTHMESALPACNIEETAATPAISSQQSTIIVQHSPPKKNQTIDSESNVLCKPGQSAIRNKQFGSLEIKPLKEIFTKPIKEGLADSRLEKINENKVTNKKKHKINCEGAETNPVNKIRKNIRFASEVRTQLLHNSKITAVEVKRRTKKSPGRAAIDGTKRELRSKVRALNITGDEEKTINSARSEMVLSKQVENQDSVMDIDEDSEKYGQKPKSLCHLKSNLDNYEVRRKLSTKQRKWPSFVSKSTEKVWDIKYSNSVAAVIKEHEIGVKSLTGGLGDGVQFQQNRCVNSAYETDSTHVEPDLSESLKKHDSPHPPPVEPVVQNKSNDTIGNKSTGHNLGMTSKELLSADCVIESNNNATSDIGANVCRSRNSNEPKTDCYHLMPCKLFKTLKEFLLSQECQSNDKGISGYATSTNICKEAEYEAPLIPLSSHDDAVNDEQFHQAAIAMHSNTSTDLDRVPSPVSNFGGEPEATLNTVSCGVKSPMKIAKDDGNYIFSDKVSVLNECSNTVENPNEEIINIADDPSQASASILHNGNHKFGISYRKVNKYLAKTYVSIPSLEGNCTKEPTSTNLDIGCSLSSLTLPSIGKTHGARSITSRKRKFRGKSGDGKKYKRIKAIDSSDLSSEELVDFTKTDENKYYLDSEELRDFERYDENVMKLFRSQTNTAKHNDEDGNSKGTEDDIGPTVSPAKKNNALHKCNERLVEIDSSDDEIPCTDDAAIGLAVKNFANRKSNEDEEQISKETPEPSKVKSSESTIHPSMIFNDTLHQEEELREEDDRGDIAHMEDVENMSFASAISTQSAFISTQKKNKMECEVAKLRAEINALEELKKNRTADKSLVKKSVKRNRIQSDFIEIFSTVPSASEVAASVEQDDEPLSAPSLSEDKENVATKLTVIARKSVYKRNYTNERIVIVCTGLSGTEVDLVHQFAMKICGKNSRVLSTWTPSVSHVIVHTNEDGVTERTLKYLYGVANGAWIVSYDWIKDSLKLKKLQKEDSYEALDCTGVAGPHRGRTLMRHVFDGCQLCLIPPFSNLSLLQVDDLVSICGADVLREPVCFKDRPGMKIVIVNSVDPSEECVDIKYKDYVCVTYDWLIECIGMASRISLMPYIVGNPNGSQVAKSCIPTALLCETQNIW